MSDLPSIVAVTVDDQPVSLRDVLHAWKVAGHLERLLEQAVQDRLIAEAARAEGVVVTDVELQTAADAFRKTRGLHKASDTEAWLAERRLGVEDFQTLVERPLLRRKLAEHLTRGQVERYFAENRSQFDRARLSQIVVGREGIASELMAQITEDGADFAALARKHSLDSASAPAGGSLGVVDRKKLSPSVEAAVFGARPGDVVGPFKTAQGFHVIKVEEILPAQLDDKTTEAIRDRLFEDWLRQRQRRARVQTPLLDLV
ncbi:MAG: peptidylprolyl isomerase [Planctomycetes bacterium]|nr:peptidylprolyl isomerase [Planctomycetota bacterium]